MPTAPTLPWSVAAFVRFGAIGFSLVVPLLGAATVADSVAPGLLARICAIAACFHVFAFVSNDLVDLPVDRTEPRRAAFPLVRGVVSPTQAATVALLQVPSAFALAASLHVGSGGYAALGAALVMMTVYNLAGKRSPVPWLTDAVQGGAWAALALFGVHAVQGRPNPLTAVVLVYLVVYVQMVNGVHGGVRDLANDLRHGLRTTAIRMGAGVREDGRTIPGSALTFYALVLQVLLVGVALLALATPRLAGEATPRRWILGTVLLSGALSCLLLGVANRSLGDVLEARAVGLLHMVCALTPLLAIVGASVRPPLLATVVALFVAPLVTLRSSYPSARWIRRTVLGERS